MKNMLNLVFLALLKFIKNILLSIKFRYEKIFELYSFYKILVLNFKLIAYIYFRGE